MMLQMNGKGNHAMTTPAPQQPPPEPHGPDKPEGTIYLFTLRLWIICCMIIVGFGIANYILNWVLATGQ